MKCTRKFVIIFLMLSLGYTASSANDKESIEGESFHAEYTAENLAHDEFDTLEGAAWHDLSFSINETEREDMRSPANDTKSQE